MEGMDQVKPRENHYYEEADQDRPPGVVQDLVDELDVLSKCIGLLESRLSPVLRKVEPSPEKTLDVGSDSVLGNQVMTLRHLRHRLEQIVTRVVV